LKKDIPWGHNIGWSRCHQQGGKFHLILSNNEEELI